MNSMHPTIGFLTTAIGENVSQAIWSGVVGGARELGANLICFAGEALQAVDGPPVPYNVAFDLASAKSLDGLVS
jgi:hypothetical protein